MAEFPAMPLWTDAYLGDTKHLSTLENGAYLLLLMTAWRAKSHTLPDDDKKLAAFCGLTSVQWRRIKPTIREFFRIENGQWINDRLLRELVVVRRHCEQRSMAGRASALKRFKMDATSVQRSFNGRATPTPTPIKKEEIDGKMEGEQFYAMPQTPEFEAWKSWATDNNRKGLKALLRTREIEGRPFPFEAQWPPGWTNGEANP